MKQFLMIFAVTGLVSFQAMAAQSEGAIQYDMRVDGMACPYCAYGIEKKLKTIDGVHQVDVDLEKGIVSVCTTDDVTFTDKGMTALFKDAGFTYRNMEISERCSLP